jgi:hypothetical protein
MRRTFKFLMRPTVKQAVMLGAMLDDHRRSTMRHCRNAGTLGR